MRNVALLIFSATYAVSMVVGCSFPRPVDVQDMSGTGGGDASPSDAAAPESDADRGTVHVTVVNDDGMGQPAAFVPVVFTDPHGAVVTASTTDVSGKATADVFTGGAV